MGKRKGCPVCGSFNLKRWALGKFKCAKCNSVHFPSALTSTEYVPKTSRRSRSTRGQANRQEKKKAREYGVHQTIASGQTPIDKGDLKGRNDGWKEGASIRVECKYTDAKSYRLSADSLSELASVSGDSIPILLVEFRKAAGAENTFCVVPEGWFKQLLGAYVSEDILDK